MIVEFSSNVRRGACRKCGKRFTRRAIDSHDDGELCSECYIEARKIRDNFTRVYSCEYYSLKAHPRSCFFCDHLTDIFWDYSHGPYMFFCEIEQETDTGMCGECKQFVEEDVGE